MTEVEFLIRRIADMVADERVLAADWLTNGADANLPESVVNVIIAANLALITTEGRPNFAAHRELAAAGHPVRCGERDSFGWLTGVIMTPKGRIVYG